MRSFLVKKLFILLTLVGCTTFSTILLAEDFNFPGITTKQQVRLELWVYGPKKLKKNKQTTKLDPDLEHSLQKLETQILTN